MLGGRAHQEIRRLVSQLELEEATNKSLQQRLDDFRDGSTILQDAFRAGIEVFSTAYLRAQRLVLNDNDNDTRPEVPQADETLAAVSRPETLIESPRAPTSPAPVTSASSSPPSEAPTPSSSAESTPATPDMDPVGSASATGPPITESTPAPPTAATVETYALLALNRNGSCVPQDTQSAVHSSVVKVPTQKFNTQRWAVSDSIKRNLGALRYNGPNKFHSTLVECVHSGTSGVVYEIPGGS